MSDELKEKIRASNINKKHVWTEDSLARFREKKAGKPSWNKGIKLSPERVELCRSYRLGVKDSPEVIERKRERMIGDKNPNWNGGITTYERKLWHNRNRRALLLGSDGSHTQEEWEQIKSEHGNKCKYCSKHENETVLTVDHIIPLSKGGSNKIENIQPLCKSCNSRKHNKIIS